MNYQTKIRLVDMDDLDFLIDIRNDPVVSNNLGSYRPLNRARQEQWITGLTLSNTKEYFVFEIKEQSEWHRAGLVRITEIDFVNRSACVGADIHQQFRGKNLAKKIYDHIFDHIFNKYNLNRAWLKVLATNLIAINLYKSVGFKDEGILREAIIRDGNKIDYLVMSILYHEYATTIRVDNAN